jgi:DNA-binding MarR family transcriptional regulator
MKTKLDTSAWPGHVIRRLQQTAVQVFHQETAEYRLTPTQFVTLLAIQDQPGVDQVSLSQVTMIDRSMTARIVEALAQRGLIRKRPGKTDKRANALFLAPKGAQVLTGAVPAVEKSQMEILSPLSPAERPEFIRMVQVILAAHEKRADARAVGADDEAESKPKQAGRKSSAAKVRKS